MIKKTKEMLNTVQSKDDDGEEKQQENKKESSQEEGDIHSKKSQRLFDFIGKERTQLTKQFEDLRTSTLAEMERSKSLLKTLKTLKAIEKKTGDTDENSELEMSITTMEEGVEKFQMQLE